MHLDANLVNPKINHAARQSQHAQTRNPPGSTRAHARAGRDRGRGSHSDPRHTIGHTRKLNPGRVGRAPAGQSRRERARRRRAGDVRLFFTRRGGGCVVPSWNFEAWMGGGPWGFFGMGGW